MTQEFERPRFRPGESTIRPYGGKISDDPLSQALYKSAALRGFESQSALVKALKIRPNTVSKWYRGKGVPTPSVFGDLLVLFDLNDEEREPVVEAYAKRLAEKEASRRLKISRSMMQPSNNPFGEWIENFCQERAMTIVKCTEILEISSNGPDRRNYGRETLGLIRQNAKDKLKLSEEQSASLSEAIDNEIQQRTEEGHRFQSGLRGKKLVKEQRKLNYRTYNGAQTAVELGVTRAMVSNLRKEFGLPYFLTEEDLRTLKEHLDKTKGRREKFQQSMMKKRTGNLLVI